MVRELVRYEAAALAGIAPATFGGYVSRGQAPRPTRRVGRTPLWDEDEVKRWAADRPGRGSRESPRAIGRARGRRQQLRTAAAGRLSFEGASTAPRSLLTAERTLATVSWLAETRYVRVFEVARREGISRPAAHRLLTTLVAAGYAVRDEYGPGYLPGQALLAISRGSGVVDDVKDRARVALRMLHDEVDETLHVGIRQGNGMRLIEGVRGRTEPAGELRVGLLLPAHTTAAGKAALANLTDDEIRALHPRGLLHLTPRSLETVDDLLSALARVRSRGYALNVEEAQTGISGIAVAAPRGIERGVVAIVVTAPTERLTNERIGRIVPRLRRAAEILGSEVNRGERRTASR